MRRNLIVGNWKMHKTVDEGVAFVKSLLEALPKTELPLIAVCPPFPLLVPVSQVLTGTPIGLGAQDVYDKPQGAYTGQVSAAMLKSAGCQYVIIGHSERRQFFGEDDNGVALKVRAALNGGLTPIVCIGERIEERKAGRTLEVIERQLRIGLSSAGCQDAPKLVIAYEPVWAIGTGETATPEQAQEVHHFIRDQLAHRFCGDSAETIPILYGGSVKPDNAAGLLLKADIDGALVGGACLKTADFTGIIKAAV